MAPSPNDCWYYAQSIKKPGPDNLAGLHRLLEQDVRKPTNMVLPENAQNWLPLADVIVSGCESPTIRQQRTLDRLYHAQYSYSPMRVIPKKTRPSEVQLRQRLDLLTPATNIRPLHRTWMDSNSQIKYFPTRFSHFDSVAPFLTVMVIMMAFGVGLCILITERTLPSPWCLAQDAPLPLAKAPNSQDASKANISARKETDNTSRATVPPVSEAVSSRAASTDSKQPSDASDRPPKRKDSLPRGEPTATVQVSDDIRGGGSRTMALQDKPSLVVQLGHAGVVTTLAFSPDGRLVLTASEDSSVRLWDVASGKEILSLQGHRGISSVAFSPDGQQVVTAEDGRSLKQEEFRIRLWETATGKELFEFPNSTGPIYSVAFSPDGKQLLTGNRDSLKLWDVASRKEIGSFRASNHRVKSVAFSPDGRSIVSSSGNMVRLWDVASGKEIRALEACSGEGGTAMTREVVSVAFSSDGRRVLSVSHYGSIRMWDAVSGKELLAFKAKSGLFGSIALSPDGKHILTMNGDRNAQLWDAATGKEIRSYPGWERYASGGRHHCDHSAIFSPDSRRILTAAGVRFARSGRQVVAEAGAKAVLWDVESGKEIRTFKCHVDFVRSVAFSPDGKQILTERGTQALLWDRSSGKKIREILGQWGPTENMAVSPDLRYVVTWGREGLVDRVRLWDSSSGKHLRTFEVPSRAFLRELRSDDVPLREADPDKLSSQEYWLSSVAFSPDSKLILTRSCVPTQRNSGPIRIWDIDTGKQIGGYFTYTFGGTEAICGVMSPDCKRILTMSGSHALLLDVANGKTIGRFGSGPGSSSIDDLGFSPDGKLVLTRTEYHPTELWVRESGKRLSVLEEPSEGRLSHLAFAFSPDNRLIVTGHEDTKARLWDTSSGKQIRAFIGHTAAVTSVAFALDGKQVLTGSLDGTVRSWDAISGREIYRQASFPDGHWIVSTPDNYYMASRGNLQGMAFRVGKHVFAFDQFDLRFNRPDKVLESIGQAPQEMISAYRQAYQKRLKRMNITDDMLSDDFHVPEITLKSGAGFATRETTLKLIIQASDSKYLLDRVYVDVNGVPVHGRGGFSLRDKRSNAWKEETEIELSAGENKIDVSVLNEKGAASRKESVLIQCDAPAGKPDLYLVAVGVSDYRDSRFRLTYADKDARDLADLFESKRDRFGQVKVQRFLNRDATRENIQKVRDFLKASRVDDVVVLFFAGHGLLDSKSDYYFATADIDFTDPARRGLPYEAIEDLLDGLRSRKKLLLMDTCHSGELDKENIDSVQVAKQPEGEIKTRTFRSGLNRVRPRLGLGNSYQLLQEMFADLRRGTGAVAIASAGGAEYAIESADWRNGVFTHALLRGLKGEANRQRDGYVSISKLRDFVEQEVRRLTSGRQTPTARRENLDCDFTINIAKFDPFAHPSWVTSVTFSADGKQVLTACRDGIVRLWDTASGQEIRALKGEPIKGGSPRFSPDGKHLLISSAGNTVQLLNAANRVKIGTFRGHSNRVGAVDFSPDGKQVLTGSEDRTARLWDIASGQEIHVFKGHRGEVWAVAFSPDGKQVLTGSQDKTARLWDAASGQEVRAFQGHTNAVWSVAFSRDGKWVLTGSRDTTARLWDAASGQEIRTFHGHTDWVRSVAFSPDGKQMLTGGYDKTARLWDAAGGQEIRVFKAHSVVWSVAISPDGKQILTGEGQTRGPLEKRIEEGRALLWDASSGKVALEDP